MSFRLTVSRVLAIASALAIGACSDSPTPSEPSSASDVTPSYERSVVAQQRLAALFPQASADVMSLPGTVFADHDERAGKLVFGVENRNAIPGVERALAARGIAAGNYAIEVTSPIRQLATLRDRFDPTQGGIQIHFGGYLCTLGFNVTAAGNARSFITNSHCTNTQGGVEGTVYYQPTSTVDPTAIADEVADPTYFKGGVCPKGKLCRYSDASRALYRPSRASAQGVIGRTTGPNNGSITTAGTFTVGSQDNNGTGAPVGTVVNKVGRTTGWTQGAVTRTCVNTNVQGSRVHQLCQTFVGADVAGGDSGSPVFKITNASTNTVELLGILWGGGTDVYVFSPLNQIQQELGSFSAQ